MFCSDCFGAALIDNHLCPNCKIPVDNRIKRLALKSMIAKQYVYCPHRPKELPTITESSEMAAPMDVSSCDWIGPYSELLTHLQERCLLENVQCSNPGCMKIYPRGKLYEHSMHCDHRVVTCPNCEMMMPLKDLLAMASYARRFLLSANHVAWHFPVRIMRYTFRKNA